MSEPRTSSLDWRSLVRWLLILAGLAIVPALLAIADAWAPLVPKEEGRKAMELFLRAVLIVYLAVIILVPLVLVVSVLLMRRAYRSGGNWKRHAKLVLGAISCVFGVILMEAAAAAWLAWSHRVPSLPTSFSQKAASPGELSLVVIGGSSALGYPYDPHVSVGKIVGRQLELAKPGRTVEVNNLSLLAKNLEDMHKRLTELQRKPDILIIYSGHNEFLSRFDTSRMAGYDEAPENVLLGKAYQLSLHSPLCVWLYELVGKHRLGGPPGRLNKHQLLDQPMFTPSEYRERVVDFRRRLEAIVSYCDRMKILPILIIPPANESGFEPNRTVLPHPLSPEEAQALTARILDLRSRELAEADACLKAYQELVEAHPELAEVHFRMGRILERNQRYDQALAHYIKARDLDGFPVRCRTEFAQIYRDVAARHETILIDGPEVLRTISPRGILDDTLFHDAHHPSLASHVRMAQEAMDQLTQRGLLGLDPKQPAATISATEIARAFQVDAQVWRLVCARNAIYYSNLSGARYDPVERQIKHDRFKRAADELLADRITPEETGLPGIGLAPPHAFPVEWWLNPPTAAGGQALSQVAPPNGSR